MSLAEGSFSSGLRVISTTIVEGAGIGGGAEIGSEQAGSGQALFKEVGLIAMDLDRCLCYLSRNPTLKFEVISSSSSSSLQIMGGPPGQPLSLVCYWKLKKIMMTRRMKLMEKTKVQVAESLPSKQAK